MWQPLLQGTNPLRWVPSGNTRPWLPQIGASRAQLCLNLEIPVLGTYSAQLRFLSSSNLKDLARSPQGPLWSLGILVGKQAGPRNPGLSAELVKHCPWGPNMQDLMAWCPRLSPVQMAGPRRSTFHLSLHSLPP